MIFLTYALPVGVAIIHLDANPLFVEMAELPPFGIHQIDKVAGDAVGIAPLAKAEIRVDGCNETIELLHPYAFIVILDGPGGTAGDSVVEVHPIHLDVGAEKLHALGVVLAIEFPRVKAATKRGHSPPDLRHQCKERFLILHHRPRIINEAAKVDVKLIPQPMIQIIEIVIHRILPYEMPDCATHPIGLRK